MKIKQYLEDVKSIADITTSIKAGGDAVDILKGQSENSRNTIYSLLGYDPDQKQQIEDEIKALFEVAEEAARTAGEGILEDLEDEFGERAGESIGEAIEDTIEDVISDDWEDMADGMFDGLTDELIDVAESESIETAARTSQTSVIVAQTKALLVNNAAWIAGAAAIAGVYYAVKAYQKNQKEFAEDTKKLTKDINDAKNKFADFESQYKSYMQVINSPLSTADQIADARLQLMDLQKQMQEEFPDVEFNLLVGADMQSVNSASNKITNALDQQIDKYLREYDTKYSKGLVNGFVNLVNGWSGGLDRARANIEDYAPFLENSNVYDRLEELKQLRRKATDESEIEEIDRKIQKAQDVIDKYGEAYDLYLTRTINNNDAYKAVYDNLSDINRAYEDALVKGDRSEADALQKSFVNALDGATSQIDDENILRFFKRAFSDNMGEAIKEGAFLKDWQDGLENSVGEAVKYLESKGYTKELIDSGMGPTDDQEGFAAWELLNQAAQEYGLTIMQIIDLLQGNNLGAQNILSERDSARNNFLEKIVNNNASKNNNEHALNLQDMQNRMQGLADEYKIPIEVVWQNAEKVFDPLDDAEYNLKKLEKELKRNESEAAKFGKQFDALMESDDFKNSLDDLKKLAVQSKITGTEIQNLANENETLSQLLEESGISAEFAASCFQSFIEGGKGFGLITEQTIKLDKAVHELADELKQTSDAYAKYEAIMNADDYDKQFENVQQIYADAETNFQNGEYGKHFWAQMQYLFGESAFDMSIDELRKKFVGLNKVFGEKATNGYEFLQMLYKNKDALKGMSDEFSITYDKTKGYTLALDAFSEDSKDIENIAKALGLSEEAVISCIEALNMFGQYGDYNIKQVEDAVKEFGLELSNGLTGITENQLENYLMMVLGDAKAVHDIIKEIKKDVNSGISVIDLSLEGDKQYNSLDEIEKKITKLTGKDFKINLDVSSVEEVDKQLSNLDYVMEAVDSSDLSGAGLDSIQQKYEALLNKRRELQEPVYLKIEQSDTQEIANAKQTVQNYMDLLIKLQSYKLAGKEIDPATIQSYRDAASALDKLGKEHPSIDLSAVQTQINTAVSGTDAQIQASLSDGSVENITHVINSLGETEFTTLTTSANNALQETEASWQRLKAEMQKNIDGHVTINLHKETFDAFKSSVQQNPIYQHVYTVMHGDTSGGGTTEATGTMTSIKAHAQGTVLSPAHADGHVALAHDEVALSNELGPESVVRDGVWQIIPGGPHVEKFKKNDIIFNAEQTQDLLDHGYTNGTGMIAHADGTVDGMSAYALYPTIKPLQYQANSTKKKSSSSDSKKKSDSKSKSGKSGSEKEADVLDWIETLIERIEREITNLGNIAEATWDKWTNRTKALGSEIAKVTEELSIQSSAAATYLKQAESIGLSDAYKKKVQNGELAIESITDEELQKKIEKYKEFYEKYLAALDKEQELYGQLADLAQTKFDQITTQYEEKMQAVTFNIEMIEGYIDQVESQGYLVSTEFYQSLIGDQNKNIEELQNQYEDLIKARDEAVESGYIQQFSQEWYELSASIDDVAKSIQEANSQLIEYRNTMRELEWSYFEKGQENVSKLIDETEFLLSLMENEKLYEDNGQYTVEGQASVAMHAMNYDTYMREAQAYADEIKKINEDLANDPNNQTLIDKQYEFIQAQREAVLAAKEQEQAIKDLVSNGYDKMLEYLGKIVDKYNEELDAESDLYDYRKNISEQTTNISNLQKQLSALSGDGSQETIAQLQRLEKNLKEAEKELQETEYDKWKSDQQQMLDNLSDDFEEWINQRLDDLNGLLIEQFEMVNATSGDIATSINQKLADIGDPDGTMITGVKDALVLSSQGMQALVSPYLIDSKTHMESVLGAFSTTNTTVSNIYNGIQSMITALGNAATTIVNGVSSAVNKTTTQGTVAKTTTTGSTTTINTSSSSSGSSSSGSSTGGTSGGSSQGNGSGTSTVSQGWKVINTSGKTISSGTSTGANATKAMDAAVAKANSVASSKGTIKTKASSANKATATIYTGFEIYNTQTNTTVSKGFATSKAALEQLQKEWKDPYKPYSLTQHWATRGYAKGGKDLSDLVAWTQEQGAEIVRRSDGALLTPLSSSVHSNGKSMVFNNEMSERLWEFAKNPANILTGFEQFMPKGDITTSGSIGNSFDVGGINITVVANNPREFAEQLKQALSNDKNVRKVAQEVVLGQSLGNNSLKSKRY